ncbi:MAG: hypothetical protein KF683_01270 [Rubrivivax sp.]|nr:hypothetical protein [Rubrivivax sp.]
MGVTMRMPPALELDPRAVYLSPTGRRCRWWPFEGRGGDGSWAVFVYDLADGTPARSPRSDGFVLSRGNWYVLRVLGRAA